MPNDFQPTECKVCQRMFCFYCGYPLTSNDVDCNQHQRCRTMNLKSPKQKQKGKQNAKINQTSY